MQISEAMKTLSLAGLKANEILAVTGDVLNFSVAGTTSIETAAATLMSVSTAFGMGSAGFARVGDIISKAAAESMTSVENFSSAMKTASVINAQYGVSLEDTATALAAMSQLGIEGTSAGTALRNMYADLSGRSGQVAKVLRSQGIELRNTTTGGFRPMIEVVSELNTKLQSLSALGQKNLMQALLSERGAKGIIEMLRLINSEAKDAGSGMANALAEMRSKIGDSAGFAAITAAKLAQTAESQFKAVQATMQGSMVEAYRAMEPTLMLIARDLKAVFASDEFKSGLSTLVTLTAEFARVLVENAKVIGVVALAYAGLKIAQMGTLAVTGAIAALTRTRTTLLAGETLALQANSSAQMANNATKAGALVGAAGLARAIPLVGQALAAGTAAWLLYDTYMGNASRTSQQADDLYNNSVAKSLNDEADKLATINKLMREGLTLQEAQIKLRGQQVDPGTARSVKDAKAAYEKAKQQTASLAPAEGIAKLADPVGEGRRAAARLAAMEKEEKARRALTAAVRADVDAQLDIAAAAERVRTESIEKDQHLARQMANKTKVDFGKIDFELGAGSGAGSDAGRGGARATLDAIIKREEEQKAALKATQVVTSIFDQADQERAKNLKGLSEQYENVLKNFKDLTPEKLKALDLQREEAEALIEANYALQIRNVTMRAEYAFTQQRTEALHREAIATDELANARYKAAKESSRQLQLQEQSFAFDQSVKFSLPAVQAVEKARFAVRASYVEKYRNLEIESGKRISEMRYTEDGELRPDVDISGELLAAEKAKAVLSADEARALGLASAKAYQEAWDQTTSTIASNFTSKLMDGTLDIKEFMIETFANMVLQPQVNLLMQQGADALLGSAGGWFSTLMGLPSFEGGGSTGTGPRSGGLDGKGGFPALVHPNETIIDHTKAGNGMSSAPVYVTIHNTVGDVATKSMLDQANAATVKQIQAGIARSSRYNGAMAR
jgi:TP901 family phage tail tape measure protein